jgi:1-deoxyxylulose-5-phosphate synthase
VPTMLYADLPKVRDRVSRLILGTGSFSPTGYDRASALLDAFVDAGGNAIDTAAAYGMGASERAIGQWLRDRRARDRITIIGKGAMNRVSDWGSRINRTEIAEDITASLDRLQVSAIDLYLLHRDDTDVPVAEIIDALNEHVTAGHIRSFGVSNWGHDRIEEADLYARSHGLHSVVASSPNLALAVARQSYWPGVVSISENPMAQAWYGSHHMPVLAWSSQAHGFFSGRHTRGAPADARTAAPDYDYDDNWERLERARRLADRHQCTATQIALSWLLNHPLKPLAIIGPGSVEHLRDCIDALDIHLSADERAWVDLRERVLPDRWEAER